MKKLSHGASHETTSLVLYFQLQPLCGILSCVFERCQRKSLCVLTGLDIFHRNNLEAQIIHGCLL